MFIRLWFKMTSNRRNQFLLLLGFMLLGAMAEIISLGLVIPFLAALTSPDELFAYATVQHYAAALDITSADQLIVPLAITFAVVAVVAGLIRLSLLWLSTVLSNVTGADLSVEIYKRTLYQPYQLHVSRNSSEILSGITLKTAGVVAAVLVQILMFISSTIIIAAILGTLIYINPSMTMLAFGALGGCYMAFTFLIRNKLSENSYSIASAQTNVVKTIQEGLGSIRDIILDNAQSIYLESYSKSERKLRMSVAINSVISITPRFVLESLAMVLIAVLAINYNNDGGILKSIPILGALAFGAQRLLPMLQQAYSAWAKIEGARASLIDTLELLDQPLTDSSFKPNVKPINFNDTIRLDNIIFRYTPETSLVINDISLTIKKGRRVGFVGGTGCGKSTLTDVIMGLLYPVSGSLCIDGNPINEYNRQAWQKTVAHVPQSVYLSDNTLAENIAFGIENKDIDISRVKKAAKSAQINDFIETLPKGYDTSVGERGVRLSGGQCQRIGIARALYKNASVLIFDEATSALDTKTEMAVMDSINALDHNLTILIIAHRLSTVQKCDVIFEIEQGKIVAKGSYSELLENSSSFREKVFSA